MQSEPYSAQSSWSNSLEVTAKHVANPCKPEGKPNKKDDEAVPVFLTKTYNMIDQCDPSIAGWSKDGDNFVIKDPDVFASEVIPQYFRHNNFSSFVRQLNFYGFRKIKADFLTITTTEDRCMERKYWRFRHENFLRGRQDLLSQVRKTAKNGASNPEEIDALKQEIETLKEHISTMSNDMKQLKSLVSTLLQVRNETNGCSAQEQPPAGEAEEDRHQRKRQRSEHEVTGTSPQLGLGHGWGTTSSSLDSDVLLEEFPFGWNSADMPSPDLGTKLTSGDRRQSMGSVVSLDSDFMESVCGDIAEGLERENSLPAPVASSEPYMTKSTPQSQNDSDLINNLHNALSSLPRAMKELLVERIVSTINQPGSFETHMDAVYNQIHPKRKRQESNCMRPVAA